MPNPPFIDVPLTTQGAWRPSTLVWISVGLHGALLLALLISPHWAAWALLVLVLNHLVLTLAGLLPRCDWLGPNHLELDAQAKRQNFWALTIDDGPDPAVTPQVLDLLDRHQVRATFFCIGERAAAHPDLVRAMVDRGHSVQNHSHRHRHVFSLWGPGKIEADLRLAQRALQTITGVWPQFFRAPAGLRNPFLDPVLHRLGLRLVSWTARGYDTRETDPHRALERLWPGLRPGGIVLIHDGHAARTATGEPMVLAMLPDLLERAARAGLHAVTLPEGIARPSVQAQAQMSTA